MVTEGGIICHFGRLVVVLLDALALGLFALPAAVLRAAAVDELGVELWGVVSERRANELVFNVVFFNVLNVRSKATRRLFSSSHLLDVVAERICLRRRVEIAAGDCGEQGGRGV